ncbi:phosphatase PAP2 family protein [Massilia aerilata]|uniref:Phosphatase PAP2 family protein n=1 Tax=Massilia aerilata TaxID=453817 RepID=A0ABW0RVC4_9BURK
MRPPLGSPWAWLPPATALALLALLLATGGNQPVFLALNHAGHAVPPLLWLHLTMFGDGAVALALVLPCIRRLPHCFWAALAAAVFAALWTQVTKQFIDLPRPLAALPLDQFYQAGPAYRRVSFPSGHAAAAFAIAGIWVMGVEGKRLLRALALLLAALVGLSRIMVGVHWPADVLWGMLGGWLGAGLGLALQGRRCWRSSGVAGWLAGLVLAAVAASLLVSRHIGIPEVLPAQRLVGGVCLLWGGREMARMLPQLRRRRTRSPPQHKAAPLEEGVDG